MKRDLSYTQLKAAAEKLGIVPEMMGYWNVGSGVCVYARNGGERRRDQLTYLKSEQVRNARDFKRPQS